MEDGLSSIGEWMELGTSIVDGLTMLRCLETSMESSGLVWPRLTNSGTTTKSLRVDLEDFDGNKCYAQYTTFQVKNSSWTRKYTLNVAGYSENAGDSLAYHNGMNFTTKDQDTLYNGIDSGKNCAVTYKAWWHKYCYHST